MNIDKYQRKAQILTTALPYLRDFNQKIIVIGYMCSELLSAEDEQEIMRDITTLQSVGMKIVLVHNTRLGADPFRENKRLAKLIEFCGHRAVGICGVHRSTFNMLLEHNNIPVVTPVDIDTEYLNINPIDTALETAIMLGAEKLIYLGRYDGLVDENDEHIYSCSVSELKDYIHSIQEGLIDNPQMHEERLGRMMHNTISAIEQGVTRVHIINARIHHALLLELFSVQGVGTVFMSDDKIKYPHEIQ